MTMHKVVWAAHSAELRASDAYFGEAQASDSHVIQSNIEQRDDRLHLSLTCPTDADSCLGAWDGRTLMGHAMAEVTFASPENSGLALIRVQEGNLDLQNYTSIVVIKREDTLCVEVRDCQEGQRQVLDNTGALTVDERHQRYATRLVGQFSVPFYTTDGRLRIMRDAAAGFFHFYYGVQAEIDGQRYADVLELAPSHEWLSPDTEYAIVPFIHTTSATPNFAPLIQLTDLAPQTALTQSIANVCERVRTVSIPTADPVSDHSAFAVTRRPYHWSGCTGEALVVSFDERLEFPGVAFVFWDEMNHVPAWHMNNQLLFTYEFVESWTDDSEDGCFEPMSDRLNAYNTVTVLEDNNIRKVIRWRYTLTNPNHRVWPLTEGGDRPEVEEIYTLYANGIGTRHIKYTPKLDGPMRKWHELEESIIIAGTTSRPGDHLHPEVPLTLLNLAGDVKEYRRDWFIQNATQGGALFQERDRPEVEGWEQTIQMVHFAQGTPDAFIVFSNAGDRPDLNTGYPTTTDISWHSFHYEMSHWPVNKEPYQTAFWSKTPWAAQVSHTSVAGVEVWNDVEWTDRVLYDERGRAYREWVGLIGVTHPFDYESAKRWTAQWFHPISLEVTTNQGPGSARYLPGRLSYELCVSAQEAPHWFKVCMQPNAHCAEWMQPVFECEDIPGKSVSMEWNGEPLDETQWISVLEGPNRIIQILRSIETSSEITIRWD